MRFKGKQGWAAVYTALTTILCLDYTVHARVHIHVNASSHSVPDHDNATLHLAGHLHPCTHNDTRYPRILFPTVPRSGSTWTRLLLENATGLATGALYREGGWNEQAKAFIGPCGHGGACDTVRVPDNADPIIIKTHYPFMKQDVDWGDECVSAVIMTIRHPVDNYVAWMTYLGRQKSSQPLRGPPVMDVTKVREEYTLARFFTHWQQHHTFWHALAKRRGVPLLQVRYEDVCADPRAVVRQVLGFLGVFQHVDVNRVPAESPFGRDCMLRNLHRLPEAAALVTQGEVDEVVESKTYVMDVFGYRGRVDVWRDVVGG